MKGRIATVMVALVTIAFLVGCARVPKVKVPVVEKPTTYELDGLYLTKDENQMSGVARDAAKLGVGETVVIYARGASGGKWFKLPADVIVNWEAGQELEVTPTTGHVVTVKVIKPIELMAYVTAKTTTKDGKKIDAGFTVTPK